MRTIPSLWTKAALLLALAVPSWAVPSFTKEAGIRVSSAAAQAATGAYPALRVYYIRGSSQVFSATTADGLAWVEEAGVRLSSLTVPSIDIAISSITGLSVLPLNAGGFRMLYSVIGSTGAFRIYSATSADGLAWANDTGTAVNVDGGLTFAGFPSLVELGTGDWRLYHVQDFNGENQAADRRIFTALSTNEGRDFASPSLAVGDLAGQVAASLLTSGRVRLYYTSPLPGTTTHATILSALSTDSNGNSFSLESGIRLSTSASAGELSFPFLARSTDTFRWRLYYAFAPPSVSTGDVYSATTDAPDPRSLSPSAVFRNSPAGSFTISGEIFSPGGSAKLVQGAAEIAGTGFARPDDQTITVAFDTQGKNLGAWDLVVTNANGQSKTLSQALFIDFPGGSAVLTDNLIRPRLGTSTKIDVTIFNPGRTTLKLYTLQGELVRTLLDQEMPAGSFTLFWDGKTAIGNTVASGVYLLHASGPKLGIVNKIVVIK